MARNGRVELGKLGRTRQRVHGKQFVLDSLEHQLLTDGTIEIARRMPGSNVFERGFPANGLKSLFDTECLESPIVVRIFEVHEILGHVDLDATENVHEFFESGKIDIQILVDRFPRDFRNLVGESFHSFLRG